MSRTRAPMDFHRSLTALLAGALLLALAAVVTGCGGDGGHQANGDATDSAFAKEMIAHHRGAVEVAESARENSERPEIKRLAEAIIDSQNAEIAVMIRIGRELKAHGAGSGTLSMDQSEMGMDFDMPMLERANDFDKAFIDMMIPHHRGAIAMANKQLAGGTHGELRRIASAVIDAQTKEIAQMQAWRKQWYGAELPGPTAGDATEQGMMDHGGM